MLSATVVLELVVVSVEREMVVGMIVTVAAAVSQTRMAVAEFALSRRHMQPVCIGDSNST